MEIISRPGFKQFAVRRIDYYYIINGTKNYRNLSFLDEKFDIPFDIFLFSVSDLDLINWYIEKNPSSFPSEREFRKLVKINKRSYTYCEIKDKFEFFKNEFIKNGTEQIFIRTMLDIKPSYLARSMLEQKIPYTNNHFGIFFYFFEIIEKENKKSEWRTYSEKISRDRRIARKLYFVSRKTTLDEVTKINNELFRDFLLELTTSDIEKAISNGTNMEDFGTLFGVDSINEYILTTKKYSINHIQNKKEDEDEDEDEDENKDKDEDGDKETNNYCPICLESETTHACVPCGHKTFCIKCTEKVVDGSITKCPICRKIIQSTLKIYNVS
jgi:hypothetical protein